MPNDGILCYGGDKWRDQVGATEEEVTEILTGKHNMSLRDIHTSHLLVLVRAIYSVGQHTVLPSSGNTDVMTKVDRMVMFYLMIRRRINLVRLILDFILALVNVERRRHATLLYDMFLSRVFIRDPLPLDGHRADNKRPTTTMKTFLALGLKPQAQEKEKEKKKKDKKKKHSATKETNNRKGKSNLSEKGKENKKRRERILSLIPKERMTSKRRIMRLVEESSSSSRAKDKVSAIGTDTTATLTI